MKVLLTAVMVLLVGCSGSPETDDGSLVDSTVANQPNEQHEVKHEISCGTTYQLRLPDNTVQDVTVYCPTGDVDQDPDIVPVGDIKASPIDVQVEIQVTD